ncbi:MAG: hypothetical protein HYY16_16210 [Planctomycetes bacterium]|nr:hypothetical protein [Planctomycetota bacterium]
MTWLLDPQDSETTARAWLTARLFADAELAERVASEARRRGVLAPFFGQ